MRSDEQGPQLTQLAPLFAVVAAAVGATASASVLNGDEYGRVNLLFSLLLFALIPAASIILTLGFMLLGRRSGIASLLINLRVIPARFYPMLSTATDHKRQHAKLFYLSQIIVLAFALGTLVGFVVLLLTSDVSFVWRSTLLDAANLLPALDLISTPWFFWPNAQATLSMLTETQDYRLAETPIAGAYLGQWWRFLLAAQLCYSVAPRLILLLFAKHRLSKLSADDSYIGQPDSKKQAPVLARNQADPIAESTTQIEAGALIIDWAHTPAALVADIKQRLAATSTYRRPEVDSLVSFLKSSDKLSRKTVVILVRSWEPPLGELADFLKESIELESTAIYLTPIDWRDDALTAPRKIHELEWRRFCATQNHCYHLSLVEASE